MTLVLAALVIVVVAAGVFWSDPSRNPPPDAYVAGACRAFDRLLDAEAALGDAIAAMQANDDDTAAAAADQIEEAVAAATEESGALPDWSPGDAFNRLLGELVITSVNGIGDVRAGDLEAARAEHDLAAVQLETGSTYLAERRFGFDCG